MSDIVRALDLCDELLQASTLVDQFWPKDAQERWRQIADEVDKLRSTARQSRSIVVEIEGGVCHEVYGDFDQLIIVDYDNLKAGDRLSREQATIARQLGCEIDDEFVEASEKEIG